MYQTPAPFLLESAFTPLKTNCKPKLCNFRDENSALRPLLRLTGKQNQNPQTDRWTDWNWERHGNVVPEVLCSSPHGTAGSKYPARPDSRPSLSVGVSQKQGWQNPPREWGSPHPARGTWLLVWDQVMGAPSDQWGSQDVAFWGEGRCETRSPYQWRGTPTSRVTLSDGSW